MKKYSYQLVNNDSNGMIHAFVEAPDIQSAYSLVLSTIEALNKKTNEYVWKLDNLEDGYFAGVTNKVINDDDFCCCEDDECDCCSDDCK